jgi:hypothetical protein
VINEWYSGQITSAFPSTCYAEAINHIPHDLRISASIIADLRAAEKAAEHGKPAPPERSLPQPRVVPPRPAGGAFRRLIASAALRPGQMVVVKKGSWGGVAWTLSATDTPDGHYCVGFYSGHSGGSGCGSIYPPGQRVPFGLSFASGSGRLSYVLGPVVSTADTVSITLSNGHVITTKTIEPPKSLLPGIAFYLVEKPCKTVPQTIIGRDSAGQEVAHWSRPASMVMPRPDVIRRLVCAVGH